jgi:hypothetical protein
MAMAKSEGRQAKTSGQAGRQAEARRQASWKAVPLAVTLWQSRFGSHVEQSHGQAHRGAGRWVGTQAGMLGSASLYPTRAVRKGEAGRRASRHEDRSICMKK